MNDLALTGLARQLVDAELLTEKSAQQALQQARRNKVPLVHFLVQNRMVHSREVAEIATEHYGVALFDLSCLDKDSQPKELVSEKLVRQHHALPLWRRGNKLFVGLSDPTNHQAITDIQFSTGLITEAILVEEDKLAEAIERLFDTGHTGLEDMADVDLDSVDVEAVDDKEHDPHGGQDAEDAPVVRFVNKMLLDVIMVGEIRDLETAEIAIKAAQTGHLVLSTLHTNSAAETLTRLQNMGVAGFNIATSVNLIIAQRLARKLCPHCKRTIDVPREALIKEGFAPEQIGTFTVYEPKGCDHCNNGYKGRVGIYEVVKNTPAMQQLIMSEGNALDISRQMRADGFNDLRKSGLLKVIQGVTSLEEVNRVTKD